MVASKGTKDSFKQKPIKVSQLSSGEEATTRIAHMLSEALFLYKGIQCKLLALIIYQVFSKPSTH